MLLYPCITFAVTVVALRLCPLFLAFVGTFVRFTHCCSHCCSVHALLCISLNLLPAVNRVADFYRKLEKSSSSPPVPSALSPVPTKKPPSFTAMPRKLAPPTQLHQAALSLAGGGVRADGQHTFGGVKAEAQEQRAYGGIGGVSFTGGALKTEAHARSHTSVSVAKAEAAAATKASLFQDLLAGLTSDDF